MRTSRSAASRRSRRVSSTATTSARTPCRAQRGPTLARLPDRGAPPSTSRPSRGTLPRGRRRQPDDRCWSRRGRRWSRRPRRGPEAPPPRPLSPRRAAAVACRPTGRVLGLAAGARPAGPRHPAVPAVLPARPDLRRGVLPARGPRALDLGFEYNRGYTFIVHPPLGKWFIAIGEYLFGYNSLGWRFPSAVAGTLAVVLLARLVRRMTRSTLLGLVAGLLLALDGLRFALSRDRPARRLPAAVPPGRLRLPPRRPRPVPDAAAAAAAAARPAGFRARPARLADRRRGALRRGLRVKWSGVCFLAGFARRSRCSGTGPPGGRPGSRAPSRGVVLRGLPGAAWARRRPVLPIS